MTRTEPDSPGGWEGDEWEGHQRPSTGSSARWLCPGPGESVSERGSSGCWVPKGAETHQCPASRLRALHPEGLTCRRGRCWAAHRALQVQAAALVTWPTACKGPGEGAQAHSQCKSLVCAGGLRPVIPAQLLQDIAQPGLFVSPGLAPMSGPLLQLICNGLGLLHPHSR